MSCSLTTNAVKDRTKTVTRRPFNTWRDLRPGDRLTLIEKGMGLPKGTKQVVLAEVEVVDVRVEVLHAMSDDEPAKEGFPELDVYEFAKMWMREVGRFDVHPLVRRIEWRYL